MARKVKCGECRWYGSKDDLVPGLVQGVRSCPECGAEYETEDSEEGTLDQNKVDELKDFARSVYKFFKHNKLSPKAEGGVTIELAERADSSFDIKVVTKSRELPDTFNTESDHETSLLYVDELTDMLKNYNVAIARDSGTQERMAAY